MPLLSVNPVYNTSQEMNQMEYSRLSNLLRNRKNS